MKALAHVALALLAIPALVIVFALSPTGTGLLLDLADRSEYVEVQYRAGSLLGELQLARLVVRAGDLSVHLEDASARIDPTCLWETRFCVDSLRATRAAVWWPGGSWEQQGLEARLNWHANTLRLTRVTVERPALRLDPGPDEFSGFDPPTVDLPLAIELDFVLLEQPELHRGEVVQSLDQLVVSGRWEGRTVLLRSLEANAQGLGRLHGSGSLRLETDWPLELDASLQLSDALEQPQIAGHEVLLAASGDLSQMVLEATIDSVPAVQLAAELDVTTAQLPHHAQWWLQPPPGQTAGDWLPLPDHLPELPLQLLQLQTRGPLLSPVLTLQALDQEGREVLTGDGQLDTSPDLRLVASLHTDGLALSPAAIGGEGMIAGGLELQLERSGQAWTLSLAQVDLRGTYRGMPLAFHGYGGIDSDLRLLPGAIAGVFNGAALDLSVPMGSAGNWRMAASIDDLGRWSPDAHGALSIIATGNLAGTQATLTGQADNLQQGALQVAAARIEGSFENGAIDLELSAPELNLEYASLHTVKGRLTGTAAAHRLSIDSQGDVNGSLTITGSRPDSGWSGALLPTVLGTRSGEWQLAQRVGLELQQDAVALTDHCWDHERFQVCLQNSRLGPEGSLFATLAGDVTALNYMLPRNVEISGEMGLELEASWSRAGTPGLEAKGKASQLGISRLLGDGQALTTRWEQLNFEFATESSGITGNAALSYAGRQVAQVEMAAGRTGGVVTEVRLDSLGLEAFAPWAPELSGLGGVVSGEVIFTADNARPQARGRLQLRDGAVAVVGNATELSAFQAELLLDGDKGTLTGEGLLGHGPVSVGGSIVIDPELSMNLAIAGKDHQLLLPPASEFVASEQLQLILTPGLMELSGAVDISSGILRPQELAEGSVALSNDVVIVDMTGKEINAGGRLDVRSDVAVRLHKGFQVVGENLKAELAGDLRLAQEPGGPLQLYGNLQVLGGEMNIYRQRLIISGGTISFSGPPDNPDLDITAGRRIQEDNVTVWARLNGPLEAPGLEISSTPPMSQSEAMSYLIRGRGLDSGAGADATALALSMGTSAVNQSGITRKLDRIPLVSGVALGASGEEDDTAATVSGYIGNRLYLSYGMGIYEPISALTARLYLQTTLWLEVVSRLENSVDLYYSFEIE